MKLIQTLAFAAGLLWALSASGEVRGIFWDPNVNGEGWTFDSQQDLVAITWYRYENGNPAFRTIVAQTQYSVVTQNGKKGIEQRLTGRVYRTANGVGVDEGPFTGVFYEISGQTFGAVNAAGTIRELEPFIYNYGTVVDFYRGLWTVASAATSNTPGGLDYALFNPTTFAFDDGVPYREFMMSDGRLGFLYFDFPDLTTYGIIYNSDGTNVSFSITANNESVLGVGAVFSSGGTQLSDVFLISASALTTSDKETTALLQVLGLLPPSASKNLQRVVPNRETMRAQARMAAEKRGVTAAD